MYKKILIIIRRSLGDVLATSPMVNILHKEFPGCAIDLLVNEDTIGMAYSIRHINQAYSYSYAWREKGWWECIKNEFSLIRSIVGKYDLAISLTGNERSTIYAILAGKTSIAATDKKLEKSWWRRTFLTHTYLFDANKHIVLSNLASIAPLGIKVDGIELSACYYNSVRQSVKKMLDDKGIGNFLIFHPSARFKYKIYPRHLRDKLLGYLSNLGISIVITGGKSDLDREISSNLPTYPNVHNFINKTTLGEAIALTDLSMGYVGMDTFNMHIAAALNKKAVAIFGPTLPQMWSPWSNSLQTYANETKPIQRYGNITLLQADMPCVACGLAGCDDKACLSECLYEISPETILAEVKRLLILNDSLLPAAAPGKWEFS